MTENKELGWGKQCKYHVKCTSGAARDKRIL